MIVVGRWWWTADKKRLVREGSSDAAYLAYPDGTEIPDREAARVGLLPAPKAVRKTADKMMPAPSNKSRENKDG